LKIIVITIVDPCGRSSGQSTGSWKTSRYRLSVDRVIGQTKQKVLTKNWSTGRSVDRLKLKSPN